MKKLTLLLAAAILTASLSACSGKSDNNPTISETKDIPTIEMVATHAIDLDFPVSQLTFVPNSVAPWLGRIILLGEDGHLFSTDIEGRDPKPVGSGKFIDIFGLAREAAPGVFLAINTENKIEAFIESSDDGDFSPMIYAGEDLANVAFCESDTPTRNSTRVLTTKGELKSLEFIIDGNHVQQLVKASTKAARKTKACKIDTKTPRPYGFSANTKSHTLSAISSNTGAAINTIKIKNGLSIRGLNRIKYVAATQSNYGGGAYADGVLALVDKDENRIVFISLSYAERQLLKAVNTPETAAQ